MFAQGPATRSHHAARLELDALACRQDELGGRQGGLGGVLDHDVARARGDRGSAIRNGARTTDQEVTSELGQLARLELDETGVDRGISGLIDDCDLRSGQIDLATRATRCALRVEGSGKLQRRARIDD